MSRPTLLILMLALLCLPALPAGAYDLRSASPQDIQKEIDRLRVFYTDQHPDIQILLERLKRIRQLKKQHPAAPKAAPDSSNPAAASPPPQGTTPQQAPPPPPPAPPKTAAPPAGFMTLEPAPGPSPSGAIPPPRLPPAKRPGED